MHKGLIVKFISISLLLALSYPQPSQSANDQNLPYSFADLVAPLLPAVVNVSTTTQVRSKSDLLKSPIETPLSQGTPLEDFFRDFLDKMQPEGPRNASALGSGFIIDADGYIVTNYHVVADADQIMVTLNDNTEHKAKLVGRDRRTDIALLKINLNRKLPFVKWGDSNKLRTGDRIVAIGNPFGLGGTVTSGIVSHLSRDISSKASSGDFVDGYIQTDASINVGNSGGPMFDMNGNVVGVNTAIFTPTGASIGIGFAIPSDIASKVITQIRQFGRTKRGWLGVHIQPITDDIAEGLGLKSQNGALVGNIVKGGPAEKAKLQVGDVILKVGDVEVKEQRSVPRIVGELPVGKEVPITVWRRGKVISVPVLIGEFEEAEETGVISSLDSGKPLTKGTEMYGMTLQPLNDDVRMRFDIPQDTNGVLIADVNPRSAAAEKGLRPGDIILEISQEEVKSPQHVVDLLKKIEKNNRKSALILINRDGESRYVSLKTPAADKK